MGVVIYFCWLFGLSALVCIYGASTKNLRQLFSTAILNILVNLYILIISDYLVLSLLGFDDISFFPSAIGFTINTVNDAYTVSVRVTTHLFVTLLLVILSHGTDAYLKSNFLPETIKNRVTEGILSVFAVSMIISISTMTLKFQVESCQMITEVCSNNASALADEEDHYRDYIEIYNPTSFCLSLSDLYLTDDLDKEGLCAATDASFIAPGEYWIIWINQGDSGFGVSSGGGETIYLTNSRGDILDSVLVPELQYDTVYARDPDDKEWGVYHPNPGVEALSIFRVIPSPVFSAESGFYDDDFEVEIISEDNCNIYYTLDGSNPDENSILYTSPIEVTNVSSNPNIYRSVQNIVSNWMEYVPDQEPVDKATIIRAVAIDENGCSSEVITRTYFVDQDKYRDQYVLSLVSDPDALFGEDGIYVTGKEYDDWYTGGQESTAPTVNFDKKGREMEIEASVELFYDDLLMTQAAGLRLQGDGSRGNITKRFQLFSRKNYSGSNYFTYDLFDTHAHSFFMREDFADAFLQSLVTDRGLGGLDAVKASVFLDGEFWYDTYLREQYSEDYLAQEFNVERDGVKYYDHMPSEITQYISEHDLSIDTYYDEFGGIVDIQNYIDYMVCNIYLCNMDLTEWKNLRLWKSSGETDSEYDDGRWRFLLYDMDAILWNNEYNTYGIDSYGINSFSANQLYTGESFNDMSLFQALRANESFCQQFVLTFMDFANTYFDKDTVGEKLVEWGYDLSWCDSFFEKRFDYIVPYMAEEFELTGDLEEITLEILNTEDYVNSKDEENVENLENILISVKDTTDVTECTITINTVTADMSDGIWEGYYYTDYPVTLTAEAGAGYEFIAWHHGDDIYTETSVSVTLSGSENVWSAEFSKIMD